MTALIPQGVRAVFFDAVNTLLFPEPSAPRVYGALARRHGLNISPDEVRARFLPAYHAEEAADRDAGWVTSEAREVERWRRIVHETLAGVDDPAMCFRELFSHFGKPAAWRLDDSTMKVLVELEVREFAIGLGSNYDSRLLSVLEGFPELCVKGERVVVSAEIGFRKPSQQFFDRVTQAAACKPSEVLFVGDDYENDYRGASDAGINAILLDPLSRHPETRRVGDLRELLL